jgi:photosystem II stability/assembly factor-like uncharacterized protein
MPACSFSQNAFWEKVSGLPNAKVNVLMSDPSGNLFAGTNGDGIFKSTDDGKIWTQLINGLSNKYIYSLVIDKTNGYIYAGSIGGGVFRSVDNGKTWSSISNGIQNTNINSLVVNINGNVFAGTSGGGIFITTDFGDNWSKLNTGLMSNYVYSLTVNSSGYIYAGTWSGMYKSLDNGQNWLNINNGFPSNYVFSIAIDSQGFIYAGTSAEGVLRSTNTGNNWIKVNQGLPGLEIRSIVINSIGNVFIAIRGFGVYKSSDNGNSWASVSEGLTSTELRSLVMKNNGYIFAGTLGSGIFKSLSSTQIATVITDTATEISDISANLNGRINPNGFETTLKFQYGPTTAYGKETPATPELVSGTSTQKVTGYITGLTPNSTTHYRLIATNIAGTIYGSDQSLTTLEYPLSMILNTNSMIFTAVKYAPLPNVQYISIVRNGNSNLNWTVSDDANWLEISPNSGLNEGSIKVSVNTTNMDTGIYTAKITITAPRTTNSPQIVDVTYKITGLPKLVPNPFSLKFDTVVLNNSKQLTLTIGNSGMVDLLISNIKISGLDSASFHFSNAQNFPFSISPGASNNIRFTYEPKATGNHLTYIQIYNNSEANPVIVSLSGVCILSSGIELPAVPILLYPSDNSTGITINTTLGWNKSKNATSYGIQLSNKSSFENILFDYSTNDTVFSLNNLSYSTKYYWRINASNSRGTSAWSDVFSFTTSGNTAQMYIYSGNDQSVLINRNLEKPLVVKLLDAAGFPVANAEVNFVFASVPDGSIGYSIPEQKVRTDNNGLASAYVTIGSKSGLYSVKAYVSNTSINPLVFNITALPGNPSKINIVTGQNQVGYVNSYLNQFRILVTDQYVNPIPGVTIKFEIKEKPANSIGYSLNTIDAVSDSNGEAFTILRMGNVEGKYSVSASIPGSGISPAMFYVLAVLPEYPDVIYIDTNSFRLPVFPSISEFRSTDWRIIGLPGSSNKLISNFLYGTQGTDWQLYWDNGLVTNYLVKFDGGSRFIDSVGKAFWLITKTGIKKSESITSAPLNNKKEVEIKLHAHWNLITNPFNQPIAWEEIRKYNNISSPIYAFVNGWKEAEILEPFTGYLFDCPDAISILKIPYYLAFVGSDNTTNKISNGWKVNISLEANDYIDETAAFGKISGSGNILNVNFRKPRALGGELGIYFNKPELDQENSIFTTDYRFETGKINTWDFEVRMDQYQKTKLKFSGLKNIPSGNCVYLIDEKKSKYDLLADSVIYFIPSSDISGFTFITGEPAEVNKYLASELTPRNFLLGQNFPNPFNPATTIPVEIPVKSNVLLVVYNLLGREIKTIYNNTLSEGRYNFEFDGKDKYGMTLPSGIYIYSLKTGTGYSIYNKMVLIK